MPVYFRVTYGFTMSGQGMSETSVFPGPDSTSSQQFYDAVALPIALKRKELLAREAVLIACRVAKVRNVDGTVARRNVFPKKLNLRSALTAGYNAGDQPNACAVVAGSTADGDDTKRISMRCIPDEIVTDGGGYNASGANGWGTRFTDWATLYQSAQAGWFAQKPLAGPVNLTNYTINVNNTIKFTAETDIFADGDVGKVRMVRVSGVNAGSVVNGEHQVRVTTKAQVTTLKSLAVFPYSFGGQIVSYVYPEPFVAGGSVQQVPPTWYVSKIGTHKSGRPFASTVGRRPNRPRG